MSSLEQRIEELEKRLIEDERNFLENLIKMDPDRDPNKPITNEEIVAMRDEINNKFKCLDDYDD